MEKNPEIGFEKTGIALSSGIWFQCCLSDFKVCLIHSNSINVLTGKSQLVTHSNQYTY